jgi:dihydroneopterin triphosphate diphosphatase
MRTLHYVSVFVRRSVPTGPQVLLGHRAEGRYLGGTWQLIAGGIEPGETAWQAAVREAREETGLAVHELYRLSRVTQFYRPDADALCTAVPFCAITDPAAEPTINPEHTALTWLTPADAAERLMWAVDRENLDEVVREIAGEGLAKAHLRIAIGL